MRRLASGVLLLVLALGLFLAFSGGGELPAGAIRGERRDPALDAARERAQREARTAAGVSKQILFGDLHVHTQYSIDAFLYGLPLFTSSGGARPPADACDYARHCSALDFFSINDHAEGITPERWQATVESLRECEARAGDPRNPDIVPFLGWEWTQVGDVPERHYGHKNVVLRGLADGEITARPIAFRPAEDMERAPPGAALRAGEALARLAGRPYADFLWWLRRLLDMPACDPEAASPDLPPDCLESADTPDVLFRKLDEWAVDSLVIPHGLAWGLHAPPGARIDLQLTPALHDPVRQRLLEVFSGHGNTEEYREALLRPDAGAPDETCPAPTPERLACCWQAGEIMRARCGDLPEAACEAKVREARRLALSAGPNPYGVIPDAPVEAWLDCDQCRDCFKPVLTPRPLQTAQAALAVRRTGPDGAPLRFRFGFIASSDDHGARAATGFKQTRRLESTDARGLVDTPLVRRLAGLDAPLLSPDRLPVPADSEARSLRALLRTERTASYLYPGGLVAVHADGRDRDSIWRALERREVYGTSGPRILLWFDLLAPSGERVPMGGARAQREAPAFEVRAVGALRQRPGCPARAGAGLSREALAALCFGECDHPSDERVPIAAIEIVRIRASEASLDEDLALRIADPWRRFECAPDPAGCLVRFTDDSFPAAGDHVVYYARALQAPTPAINGANLRARSDASGRVVAVEPCLAGPGGAPTGDCLAPVSERAWSSPIWVDRADDATMRDDGL